MRVLPMRILPMRILPVRSLAIAVLLAASAAPAASAPAVPAHEQVRAQWRASDAVMLDRHGAPVQALRVDRQARRAPWVALADISPALPLAVLQAEDTRFMEHGGVDLRAMGQAAWDNLFRERPRGASTITMQLAGLLDPALKAGPGGRTLGQKWDQAVAARALDAAWSKAQILEAYLNLVAFRGELQGVGAAAQGLFGKAPSGLDVAESVILASLLRAPSASRAIVARRACALARDLKAATPCAAIDAVAQRAFSRQASMAPLPPAREAAAQLLKGAGENVRSTLDGTLQRHVQAVLRQQLMALRERHVADGAVLVLDNATGEILAWVGNAGGSEVDGVTAARQAGSTLKPFLYALALERRLLTAASPLDDTPLEVTTPSGLYAPQNYEHDFKGIVTARASLAGSLNVPAVRTLMLVGLERFAAQLRALGFSSLGEEADFYGPSLALGSADVTLLELTNAYRALANGGVAGGATLQARARPVARRRVVDAGAAFIVGDILADRAARAATFGLKNELAAPYWAAVKTGTSKDMRDNWCIGYTARHTVGVWVGNFDGSAMWDVSGVSGAAPVWRDVMDYLNRDLPGRAPQAPAGVVRRTVTWQPALEAARPEWFLKGTETSRVALLPAEQRLPEIVYPADGAILAVDPDIPAGRQRVFFLAHGPRDLRWRLDGTEAGSTGQQAGWAPAPGKHELVLLDGTGREVDRTTFTVRGAE
ncbi:penicillin-binding protein 1C [Pseudoduganella albidiflava]|uniref:peptidoglycan glycosyltransferase n=2 Tax=Pseudoduganella albidiflava TaxID=321983 RepID=A0AA88C4U1_9BURK|nr:penicillin-binding protein 1C [Pseudoduganella albidiflava]